MTLDLSILYQSARNLRMFEKAPSTRLPILESKSEDKGANNSTMDDEGCEVDNDKTIAAAREYQVSSSACQPGIGQFSGCCTADSQTNKDQIKLNNNLKIAKPLLAKLKDLAKP